MRKSAIIGALIAAAAPAAAFVPNLTPPSTEAPPIKRYKARSYNKHLATTAHRRRILKLQRIARRRTRQCA